jgi:DNA-binding LacI/PurR family transcriptional regulator
MQNDILEKSRATCIDVARLAGVGHSTVSRVINNPELVASETRKKVFEAMRMTGYKPSSAARMLVRQKSETIGLVITKEHFSSFYGTQLIDGLLETLTAKGLKLAMSTIPCAASVEDIDNLPILKSISVDGLIFDLVQVTGDLDQLIARLGLPYILINPQVKRGFNSILPNDVSVARQATKYLIDLGHRKIAYMPEGGLKIHSSQSDRMRGYAEAMIQNNLKPMPLWDVPLAAVKKPVKDYIDRTKFYYENQGCTAIIAYNGIEAARIIFAAYQMGIKIPEDLSIVACDCDPVNDVPPVDITAFHFNRSGMGQKAVEMVEARIRGGGRDIPSVEFEGMLIPGESVLKRS